MTEAAENIPTLTDIVQKGDESMLNHFSAEQFTVEPAEIPNDLNENILEDNTQDIMEVSSIIENASTFENTDATLDEIPSITLEESSSETLASEDFSESMQLDANEFVSGVDIVSAEIEPDGDLSKIKEKIDEAVEAVLPSIEAQLKENLYKQFNL